MDIFRDDADKQFVVLKLRRLLDETDCRCCAWALLTNHAHLMLLRGVTPIGTFMARLNTSYAMRFSRRYGWRGHVFENRFKSLLVNDARYFNRLIRYIHLNPVAAGLVELEALGRYRWCGHRELVDSAPHALVHAPTVLPRFHPDVRIARQILRRWTLTGLSDMEDLVRDLGRDRERHGEGHGFKPRAAHESRDEAEMSPTAVTLIRAFAAERGLPLDELRSSTKQRLLVAARAEAARIAQTEHGFTVQEIAQALRVSPAAVRRGLKK